MSDIRYYDWPERRSEIVHMTTTPRDDEQRIDILAEALYNERYHPRSWAQAKHIADIWREQQEKYTFGKIVRDVDDYRRRAKKLLAKL